MTTLHITINMDNAAFEPSMLVETNRLLMLAASRLQLRSTLQEGNEILPSGIHFLLQDANGNTCGTVEVVE